LSCCLPRRLNLESYRGRGSGNAWNLVLLSTALGTRKILNRENSTEPGCSWEKQKALAVWKGQGTIKFVVANVPKLGGAKSWTKSVGKCWERAGVIGHVTMAY